ncbi:MAG: YidC/Oxa1 family membrane protein insertase, partial [Actinomycetota bacterium]
MVAVVVMLLITPLTLKSTKGMLEMQKLQPEMKRMQQQFKGDRQKMNEAGRKRDPRRNCPASPEWVVSPNPRPMKASRSARPRSDR